MTRSFQVVCADPAWHCSDQLPGKGRGATKHYETMTTDEICKLARTFVRWRGDKSYHQLNLQMNGRMAPIADDAILFCWRLASMQTDALEVARSWGFTDKTEIVWAKYRPCVDCRGAGSGVDGLGGKYRAGGGRWPREWICDLCDGTGCGTPWFGMGHYARAAHETCLVATRGKMTQHIKAKNVRSVLHAPVPWDWTKNRAIHSAKPEAFYTDVVQKMVGGPYLELFGRARRRGWTVLGNQVGARRVA